jgi:DNA-binding NtrC family response regulator
MSRETIEAMSTIVHVVGFKPDERAWIESALGRSIQSIVFVDDVEAFLASVPGGPGHCLIASADVDESATLKLVRELRNRKAPLPVIVLGPLTAFRTAIDIARFEATDFLERPVSVRQLRAAVHRACMDFK